MSGRAGRVVYSSPRWARRPAHHPGTRSVALCALLAARPTGGSPQVAHRGRRRAVRPGEPGDVCRPCHFAEHQADQAWPRAAWRAWALEA